MAALYQTEMILLWLEFDIGFTGGEIVEIKLRVVAVFVGISIVSSAAAAFEPFANKADLFVVDDIFVPSLLS